MCRSSLRPIDTPQLTPKEQDTDGDRWLVPALSFHQLLLLKLSYLLQYATERHFFLHLLSI